MEEEQGKYSPTSSMDSSSYPSLSSSSLSQPTRRDLSTDLRLGLSLSTTSSLLNTCSDTKEILSDWPPIKPLLRSALKEKASRQPSNFFVKVYMEGIPIGRKLDLLAINGYESLIKTLRRMFRTTITYPDVAQVASSRAHVLTYEDKEGDWMMVGDVPWEMFLTNVKRLKISRA